MRRHMEMVEGVDSKAIDNFIKLLDCFRENSTDEQQWEGRVKLMSFAMDVDYLKLNKIINEIDNCEESSEECDSSEEGLTERQLKKLQASLLKEFKPAQAAFAMRILSRMARNSSSEDESVLVEIVATAMFRAVGISPSVFNETMNETKKLQNI